MGLFIKEKPDVGLIDTPYISTEQQLVDILTLGLASYSLSKSHKQVHSSLRVKLDWLCKLKI